MASPFESRSPVGTVLSLADVRAIVADHPTLPRRRRQEMLSALRTVGRVLSKVSAGGISLPDPLARLPADPAFLAQQYRRVAPLALGMSQGRWANVRSLVHAAIGLARKTAPKRHTNPLLPGWLMLLELLPEPNRRPLSRFAHFCSRFAVGPDAVHAETCSAYREYLRDIGLSWPNQAYCAMARAWKKAQLLVPVWPRIMVPTAAGRRWTLPWDSFPGSLKQDVDAFFAPRIEHQFSGDLFDCDPFEYDCATALRPATVRAQEWEIRAFASALVQHGYDPAALTSLRNLTELEAFKDGLRYLHWRWGPRSLAAADLGQLLKTIARHYHRVDQAHLDAMGRLLQTLERHIIRERGRGRAGMTEKNRERLRPFQDERNAVLLRDLPLKLKALADTNPQPLRAAMLAQIAVAIELLVFTRLRLSNLAALDLERNLRPGSEGELIVVFEPTNVKNREAIECPVPKRTVELLDWYLKRYWPRLVSPQSTALFPGRSGHHPKKKAVLGEQVSRTIFQHLGFPFNVHLFRHFTAMVYLDRHPGGYEVVRRALAQRSLKTTIDHYSGLEGPATARHYNSEILGLGIQDAQTASGGQQTLGHAKRTKEETNGKPSRLGAEPTLYAGRGMAGRRPPYLAARTAAERPLS